MEKFIDYDEVINRLGFFINKSNLSPRALSLKLGRSESYIKRFLNKKVELKISALLDILEVLEITPFDFFYLGKEYNKDDKNMLDMFNSLSSDNKRTILELMKKLK